MCNKTRGRKQDNRSTEALIRRQRLRKQIELREEAKAFGMEIGEYMALITRQDYSQALQSKV